MFSTVSITKVIALTVEDARKQPAKEMQVGLLGRGKRDTNSIGEITEAAIIARFLQLGYVVLTRLWRGPNVYDLLIEDARGQSSRVQCKTGAGR